MMIHRFCDSGHMTKPRHPGHLPPWGSPPGPHSGVTPKVGQATRAELKAASSGTCDADCRSHQDEVRVFVDLEVVCRHLVLSERVRRPHHATNLHFKSTPPTCTWQSVKGRGKESIALHTFVAGIRMATSTRNFSRAFLLLISQRCGFSRITVTCSRSCPSYTYVFGPLSSSTVAKSCSVPP